MGKDGTGPRKEQGKREKFFYSYPSAVEITGVCRRTLCRWMDSLDMEPLQFEDNDRVFLTRPQVSLLLEYKELLHAHEPELLDMFRRGVVSGNDTLVERARSGLQNAKAQREKARKRR